MLLRFARFFAGINNFRVFSRPAESLRILVNTAIAIAPDPVRMAKAFKKAIEAGREAREIGLAEKLDVAAATSPLTGFLTR
jgi:thiazole synthase ThiGH ThiG subunit